MATIEISDLPEEAYEVIRRRAQVDGQSIEAYLRELLIEFAEVSTKAEALDAIESALEEHRAATLGPDSIVAHLHADRR